MKKNKEQLSEVNALSRLYESSKDKFFANYRLLISYRYISIIWLIWYDCWNHLLHSFIRGLLTISETTVKQRLQWYYLQRPRLYCLRRERRVNLSTIWLWLKNGSSGRQKVLIMMMHLEDPTRVWKESHQI